MATHLYGARHLLSNPVCDRRPLNPSPLFQHVVLIVKYCLEHRLGDDGPDGRSLAVGYLLGDDADLPGGVHVLHAAVGVHRWIVRPLHGTRQYRGSRAGNPSPPDCGLRHRAVDNDEDAARIAEAHATKAHEDNYDEGRGGINATTTMMMMTTTTTVTTTTTAMTTTTTTTTTTTMRDGQQLHHKVKKHIIRLIFLISTRVAEAT